MLRNENIICISSIDWDFVWQGHQEIMSTFARHGNRVLFIENTGIRTIHFKDIPRLKKRIINWLKSIKGFREEEENLFIYSPIFLPFPYSRISRWINKYLLLKPLLEWMKVTKFYQPIVWTFLPTGIALDIIDSVERKLLVYYCIADFYELSGSPKKIKITENELIKKCDLIFAQGEVLKNKCKELNKNVHIFPFGVNIRVFEDFLSDAGKTPGDIRAIKKPIIGYVGGIHRHIDFELIKFIAESNPEWSIVLIGPIQTDIHQIRDLQNVFLLGEKDFSQLPYYINEFNVCIIPYLKTEYTVTVYPTKLNEYHALGKPVVSTDLPEVQYYNKGNDNLVLIGRNHEEFKERILESLSAPNEQLINKRISAAKKNNWSTRIEEMSSLIITELRAKAKDSLNWQKKFTKLYYKAQKKIFKFSLIALAAYYLLFYTPLVWFMASPLKISEVPKRADCIVVFAGGVGESGEAGQGYEDRVKYAVELYKEGYAKHIIFSSGYRHVFKETLIMKTLAMSLGLPEEAIILEDKATNTYENVSFSKKILDDKGWKEILLISSPYHMRRVSLVFNKVAKDIKVRYVPVRESLFYVHGQRDISGRRNFKQINAQQIKAIAHEYLGILFYAWRRYI